MTRREAVIAGITFIIAVGTSSLIAFLTAPQKVVQFDLKGTVTLFTSELAEDKNLSPAAAAAMSAAFPKALETAVAEYAHTHHAVVLVSPAVMGGAPDVTPSIQKLTQALMFRNSA